MAGLILFVVIALITGYAIYKYKNLISPLRKYDSVSKQSKEYKIILIVCLAGVILSLFYHSDFMLDAMVGRTNYFIHTLLYLMCIVSLDYILYEARNKKWVVVFMLPYIYVAIYSFFDVAIYPFLK